MVSAAELRELEAEALRAEIAAKKAQASKFRAEGALIRRKDALLKLEQEDLDATAYEQRILEFNGEVNEESVKEAITTLSEWRAKGNDEITVRLLCEGGNVIDGLALYDYILALRAEGIKVDTVALGWAASMGGILLQAGTKRYISPNAHMLIHEIQAEHWGRLPLLEDQMGFTKSLEERCMLIIAERSTMTKEQIAKRQKARDWWLNAEEVINLGFADDLWPPTKKGRKLRALRR